ncbi:MAG TPA: DALR domain-containing protein, partial [Ignavibacteriaceae bacterium]|nr:DALR domain-containing protein [Ignavibacteriaceae bacterium]
GNFFTTREVLQKYSAETIRLLFSQTHYRGPLNFSDELLNAAKKGLEKMNNLVEKVEEQLNEGNGTEFVPDFVFPKYYRDFEASMDDDFNSPQAAAVIFDFIKDANKTISEHENIGKEFYLKVKEFLRRTAENVLGIIDFSSTDRKGDGTLENNLIELLITLRNEAKKEKNYRLSDQIRDELNKLGIQLQDSKDRTIFKVKKN